MIAYNYQHFTGEFIGTEVCQESPLEPGVYLLPEDATTIKPPAPREGFARCFRNGAWDFFPDHRGTAYSADDSTVTTEVRELGDLPEGYVSAPPPDEVRRYIWDGSAWQLPPVTVEDYDHAMEDHLRREREERGYTTREPSDYKDSAITRWAQDAADWIAHRDAVMLYALDVINRYHETGVAPSLEEFRAALPRIEWTINQ